MKEKAFGQYGLSDEKQKGMCMGKPKNPLLGVGRFLTDKLKLDHPEGKNKGLVGDIKALERTDQSASRDYFAGKIADCLLVVGVMGAVCLLIFLTTGSGSRIVENNQLERPGYGMGDREEELTVQLEGETEERTLTVTVQEQRYSKEQTESLLEQSRQQVEDGIKGENSSLDEVRSRLNFPANFANGAVTAEWLTMPYGMIGDDGEILSEPDEEGTLVEIQLTLSCQGEELIYETAARVYPPVLTEEERLIKEISKEADKADAASSDQSVMRLPEEVDGRRAVWSMTEEPVLPLFLMLMLVLPMGLWVQRDQKVRQKARERKLQMRMDYSDLMWKMTMLLGAGLTIRGIFSRIAAEYRRDNAGNCRYVYEEIVFTVLEMKSGVPESTAYENFGRRCDLPQYIKLGSLLSQNLKKGSRGLASVLEKEASSSMEERQNMARKMGEQAGTKLLFPMMLMFGIVLVVLIVPAFLSF